MKLLEISKALLQTDFGKSPVNVPTFRDTAVFMAELSKTLVLLHVPSLAKETPCKMTEEQIIKYYFFNKHRLVTYPSISLRGLHVSI